MRLKNDFLKNSFRIFENRGLFKGQGFFGAFGVILGFYSSMPIGFKGLVAFKLFGGNGSTIMYTVLLGRCEFYGCSLQ